MFVGMVRGTGCRESRKSLRFNSQWDIWDINPAARRLAGGRVIVDFGG